MTTCTHCPFAFTNESEEFQNYGCLPSSWDIIQMKRKSGHNWACHSNENRICAGFVDFVNYHEEFYTDCLGPAKHKFSDLDVNRGGLISYKHWYHEGEDEALRKAGGINK